ncbi:MAG: hypothetical protein FJ304_07850 [Planctomycetes bacterium]|nr:hypothetical protein [Planctomycetota bacterium]
MYLLLLWLAYVFPRCDYLALHWNWFRVRIGFRQVAVLFDDLRLVRVTETARYRVGTFGVNPGVMVGFPPVSSVIVSEEPVPDQVTVTTGHTVELSFIDDSTTCLPNFMTRFEPGELRAFF